jgi:uncharacterized membrane protein YgcG
MRLLRRLLPLLGALAFLQPAAARADERILHFRSDVAVAKDGTLDVTETIRLRSEGQEIRHGINRDFPTRYRDRGHEVRVGFELIDVQRDGHSEPAKVIPQGNGVRIRIGDAETFLDSGEHSYRIHYKTTRQLGFFQGHDELYWNATGNGWVFPIDVAEARIRLPSAAAFGARAVYTGPQGSTGQYAEVVEERPGEILFRTTAPLQREEGLTVAAAWPKGVVEPAAAGTPARLWLEDNGPPVAAVFGLLGIFAYYFHAWKRAGRGPRAGTVVPIFSPPEGLPPPDVRYVTKMGSDNRAFAAALVDLGVRGHIRLREGDKPFFGRAKMWVEKVRAADADLPAAEAAMMGALFADGDSLLMDDKYHATFQAAQSALDEGLKMKYEGTLFVRNWSWSIRGLVLMLGALWLTAAVVMLVTPVDYGGRFGRSLAGGGLAALIAAAILYMWSRGVHSAAGMLAKVAAVALGVGAACAGFVTVGTAIETDRVLPILLPLLALPLVVSAFWWMAAPTRAGRAVLDRIAGFRQYLSIAEEQRLETMHPPEKTPELFERYLPYAIALKVENQWASRFAAVLAAAQAAGNTQAMGWYSGHGDPWSDPGDFADRVGDSLSSAISSASTAPGSSSGSGGGGSSGGGGGGGGGSGW